MDKLKASVVFINMPLRELAPPNVPPLGPALLASILRNQEVDVSILDLNAYRIKDEIASKKGLPNGRHLKLKEAEELIQKHFSIFGYPDVVTFSGLITTLKWQKEIARIVKKINPEAFLVSGGGLASEFSSALFEWIPELDAVAIGEGESIINQIITDAITIKEKKIEHILKSSTLNYYVGNINNKPRFAYKGNPVCDLDILPLPAWDLLHEDVNGFKIFESYVDCAVWGGSAKNSSATPFTVSRSLTTISSRGCPFSCKFCYRGTQGQRNYRIRSAEHLAKEVRWLIEKYDVDFIGFVDDNFMVNRDRIQKLLPILKPMNIRWGTHGRMDEAADIGQSWKRAELMAEMGCVYIGFGAESAHPEVLKNMGKGGFILSQGTTNINGHLFPKTMVEAIKTVKDIGIHGNCTWIMGYPGETLSQLKTSVAFIEWQKNLYTSGVLPGSREYEIATNSVNKNMFVATAYPGTEMFTHPTVRAKLNQHFGIKFDTKTLQPICDQAMEKYVLELDDATKTLLDQNGDPLNFSAMPDKIFLKARELVNTDRIFEILNL